MADFLQPNWNFGPLRGITEAMKRAGTTVYPDVSDILARKAEGRRDISRRSFGEKIAVEKLRERLGPFKKARERRLAAAAKRQGPSAPRA